MHPSTKTLTVGRISLTYTHHHSLRLLLITIAARPHFCALHISSLRYNKVVDSFLEFDLEHEDADELLDSIRAGEAGA